MPNISIITINRNNDIGLENTIKSVINQSYYDYEFIIIDGESTDNSLAILKKYSTNINYWVSERDTGIYNAMNKGIKKSSGDYCIFMNSGDCFVNNEVLDKVVNLGLKSDIICTYKSDPKKEFSFFDLYLGLPHQSMLFKRELFNLIGGYDESKKIISDWKFYILAIIKYNKSIKFYDFIMYVGQGGGITNSNSSLVQKERDEFLMEFFPYFYEDYKELAAYKRSRIIKIFYNQFLIAIYNKIKFWS